MEIAEYNEQKSNSDSKPKLWNPNAAANWSVLFTPAFGAWLHAKNWIELGEVERAQGNRRWIWVTLTFLLINVLTIFLPFSEALEILFRIASLGILVAWYFRHAKPQVKFVKERLGNNYEKRSWSMPILAGFAAIFGYIVVCFASAFAMAIATNTPNYAEIADALEIDVRNSMIFEFSKEANLERVKIDSITLDHVAGDTYSGIAKLADQESIEEIPITVKFDGKMLEWKLEPKEQGPRHDQ